MLWVAEDCGKRLVVIWERNQSLNCSFEDLFVKPASFDLLEIKHSWFWPSKHIHSFPEVLPKSLHQRLMVGLLKSRLGVNTTFFFDELAGKLKPLRPVTPAKYKNVSAFDEHVYPIFQPVTEKLKQEEASYISTCWRMVGGPNYSALFEPTHEIACEVRGIAQQFNQETFGIHVRGTDAETARRFSSVRAFENRIQHVIDQNPRASFYLASDEHEIKQRLIDKFPSRIFFLEQASYGRNASENIKNALVDLLCLSETRAIHGAYFSTFSQVAADWKGIEESTLFREDLTVETKP